MADPIKWKSKIVLAKPEATYGVDSTPTGADNAMLMTNVSLSPMEGEEINRDLELPFLGGQETIVVALRAVLEGSIELVGTGANGVAPAWGPLLRACGVAEVITPETDPGVSDDGSVVYNPISDNHESLSLYFWIGETQHKILGARGTATLTVEANGIPTIRFTITGVWVQPAQAARVAVDLSDFEVPQAASTLNTPEFQINNIDFVLRRATMNLGNSVEQRLLIGRDQIIITDRAETMQSTVEAQPLDIFNPFAMARTKQRVPIALTHGTEPGKRTRLVAPTSSIGRLPGYENAQNVLEWPLPIEPLPTSAGNDQWSITLT